MKARQHHILLQGVPGDLQAVSDRLEELSQAFSGKREAGGLTAREKEDWSATLDYWHHVEVLQGEKDASDFPARDPLTLLDVAEKFNLAAPEQIEGLRAHFMKQAAKIMGQDVTPVQVRKLYKLLTGFNPAQPR